MPLLLLRILVGCLLCYIAGAVLTPLLWGPVLVKQSKEEISPFLLVSAGIFIAAIGYAIGQIRRK
jgi:Na+/H+ antiporter NhaD/arsenite permease-like protein